MNELQFLTILNGSFGATPAELGLTIDASDPSKPVARKGEHVLSLFEAGGNCIEWRVNDLPLAPFVINGTDTAGMQRKRQLRSAFEQATA
jgi:hypothetical protein